MRKYLILSWTFVWGMGVFKNYTNYTKKDFLVMIVLYFIPISIIYFMYLKKKKKFNIEINKTEKENSEFIISNNIIAKENNEKIKDENISKLVNLGLKIVLEKEKNNPTFNRTAKEEELSFIFQNRYFEKISKFEEQIYTEIEKIYSIFDIDKRIEQCQKTINYFYNFRKFCYNKSKGGEIYFQDFWGCYHNSKNECFSFITEIEEYLDILIKKYDEERVKLEKEYEKKIKIEEYLLVHNPEEEFIALLKEKPGILQKNIYKNFDSDIKDVFKLLPRSLEKEGKIIRIKKGSSYQLFIK